MTAVNPLDDAWVVVRGNRRVQAALDSGDPRHVHRELRRARRESPRRREREREAIDLLLSNRRLFLIPITKMPSLATVNGIGARFYGSAERDERDGSYVATLWFTLLYLPIWPLRQYLVRAEGGGAYTVLGGVPTGPVVHAWRLAVALLALILAGSAALSIHVAASVSTVHFVNGLDYDVRFQVAQTEFVVPAGARVARRLDVGAVEIAAFNPEGGEISRERVEIPSRTDAVVYNVLGADPVYAVEIVYTVQTLRDAGPERAPVIYAGETFVARDGVRYVFEEAPEEITMDGNREVRWMLERMEGGWRITAGWHLFNGDLGAASDLAASVAWSRDVPEQVEAHRMAQEYMLMASRRAEVVERYRAAHEENPDSPMYAYLHSRCETGGSAVSILEELVRTHPEYPYGHVGLAWCRLLQRDFPRAAAEFDALSGADPGIAAWASPFAALAYRAVGRTDHAMNVLNDSLRFEDRLTVSHILALGLVSRDAGSPFDAVGLMTRLGMGDTSQVWLAWCECVTGTDVSSGPGSVQDDTLRQAVEIIDRLVADPAGALERALDGPDEVIALLPQTARLALAARAIREGDTDRAPRLISGLSGVPDLDAALWDRLGGRENPLLSDLELEMHGILALHDVLTRGGSLTDEAIRADLLTYDPMGGFLTRLIRECPDP